MLPAADIAEILTNLSALNLQPTATAQILAAVLAPLMRSTDPQQPARQRQRAIRPRVRPRRAAQRKQPKAAAAGVPTAGRNPQRDRARIALKANPDKSLTKVAALAGVSRSTVVTASRELEAETRKQARREARQARATPEAKTEARARAVGFLREELAHGPKPVSAVEEQAAKAHIDEQLLAQARRDLRVVTSRSNTGGVQAVQCRLPG